MISGTTDFDPDWYGPDERGGDGLPPTIKIPEATLQQYVRILKTPAVLKYIMAHSNLDISEFRGLVTSPR